MQFVGRDVAGICIEEHQRAIVSYEEVLEEAVGCAECVAGPAPDAPAADFAAVTIEAHDGALRMFAGGLGDFAFDAEPIANHVDFTEGDAGLGHAPRSGVHAE